MSEYSYDDRPRHRHRTREREPEYVSETTYIERGGRGAPSRDLAFRPHDDSIEDIPRNFPPPGGAEYRQTKYRETYEPRRDYDDDYYDRRSRRSYDYDYHSDDYERRPKPQRRKSVVDNLKEIGEAAGLGGVIGAVTSKVRSSSRSRSRHRRDRHDRGYDSEYDERSFREDRRSRRHSSSSRSRSRSRGPRSKNAKWEQAAKAAIVAGAVEAFRSRKTPGPWTGEKGQRIATAALGAAGIDSFIDKDPDKHSKRHVAESALGGLVANRLANGSRSRSRARAEGGSRSPSRSRSRSRSRSIFSRSRSRGRSASRGREEGGHSSTLKDVAGAGAVLAAGKALYDRVRSKSRSRRERSRSVSSEDSYVPSRSRRNRAYSDHGRSMDGYSEAPRANTDRRVATTAGAGAAAGGGALTKGRLESSDSESTTDMEKKRRKMRGKELLTAGLATVATIHAAHGVYSSMVASEKRRKLVSEGEMTAEEARKRKSKNMLQDAAAVGIAALGIKSAFSEWKEMNEQRHSVKEIEDRRKKRRKLRERREKEARQNALYGMNTPMANPYAYPVAAAPYPPTTYADANPYGAVPPPPIGAPPARY
ncbi:hypothetical protein BU24DRAFT_106273 [Aaosphaeria arxii CBS 175.79]|uniref:DUF3824 domain-containing protein n=1 Tax=Aaosphaeria arxii CBS 175.79 TaxID=1450172 RepID=A0A6A5XZX4_9PLEO|nr:uncharacterized protein BU24DRAFT_106273 [Aaosphaeria arxii CBS 175.79]KAF2018848.1 hypothetical protein BU24DRAFT_106273 [Aaosphaeria arxii CBS 175.79]